MDALRRVTGGEDMLEDSHVAHLADWFIQAIDPSERHFIPFSNLSDNTDQLSSSLFGLARTYQDGHAQGFAERIAQWRIAPDVFGFIWCDPKLAPLPAGGVPTAKVFSDIDWGMLRSGWGDPQATLFALKGGKMDWDHHHLDTNHFVLYARGKPLIIDQYYPASGARAPGLTEAHNTIMVNEKEQLGERTIYQKGSAGNRGVLSGLIDAPWYAHLVGDASLAYDPADVRSFVREVMYLRHRGDDTPADYFVIFDDVDATHAVPMDWLVHTYGAIDIGNSRITLTQDDAAVDITMVAPATFGAQIEERGLRDMGSSPPRGISTTGLRWVKLRPTEPTERGLFLSVLAPRRAAERPAVSVTSIREAGLLGADIRTATTRDLALFALDAPRISRGGVEAEGRSCFVRRVGERVVAATLHGGAWLAVNDQRLFETDGYGQVVLTFGDTAIDATLDLHHANSVRLFSPQRPVRALVDGVEKAFVYDADRHRVEIVGVQMRQVRLQLR
jgi:hypothetical protein